MDILIAGRTHTFTVGLKDKFGAALTDPDSLSFQVLDDTGAVIEGPTTLTASGSVVDVVPNTALTGATRAFRVLQVLYSKGGENFLEEVEFIIEQYNVLEIGSNSFQTYSDAMLRSYDLVDIDGWRIAPKQDRQVAMVSAFHALASMNFFVTGKTYGQIDTLTAAQFLALNPRFVEALRKAQIVEANEYLSGDTPHKKRQMGIFSETIGESSMFFRTGKALPLPVTRRSLDILRGYISWEMGVGRA